MKALFDSVIVDEVDPGPTTTAAGIEIPNAQKKTIKYGKVVNVGEGIPMPGGLVPINLKPGDTICFDVNLATQFTHEGRYYFHLKASIILACFEEKEEDVT